MHSTLRPWWCGEAQLTQSSPKADRTLIDISPKIKKHRTLIQFPYLQYVKKHGEKQTQCCAFHPSSLMMWGTLTTQKLTESRLNTHRYLPKINKWYTHPVLISSICEKTINKKWCYAFHPSSLMMPGNSAHSKLTKSRLTNHRYLTENKLMRHSSSSHIVNIRKTKTNVLCIPPFVPDDAWTLSFPEAHREQIDHSSIPHRK